MDFYIDCNATCPYSPQVKSFLGSDLFWANSSSTHTPGQKTAKMIREVKAYLSETFKLPGHTLLFNSGSTEAINFFADGYLNRPSHQDEYTFLYSAIDHSAIEETIISLKKKYPHKKITSHLLEDLTGSEEFTSPPLLFWTYINNETGKINPLQEALTLKDKYNAFIAVDATQLPGRKKDLALLSELDGYFFSAHKFGGLKGVGFAFLHSSHTSSFPTHIFGSKAQKTFRGGTQNSDGIYSCKLALQDIEHVDFDFLKQQRNEIEEILKTKYGVTQIIHHNLERAVNTTLFVHPSEIAQNFLVTLDMKSIYAGTGAACQSGLNRPSRILQALHFSPEEQRRAIRFSYNPFWRKNEFNELKKCL